MVQHKMFGRTEKTYYLCTQNLKPKDSPEVGEKKRPMPWVKIFTVVAAVAEVLIEVLKDSKG